MSFSRARDVSRLLAALLAVSLLAQMGSPIAQAQSADVVWLRAADFTYGTYVIDQPGTYRLAEDISFNPNSTATLTRALDQGIIPAPIAAALELPNPVDAYHAGKPLFTQFNMGPAQPFRPGGPLDATYNPAAYGVGFFAAIAIEADGVTLDLNGHTLEQSAEHALLQRFFSLIELADQPFIPRQGPSNFGDRLQSATNVVIENGVLGRSAHHGVHGNGNSNVIIRNVDFDGYEVGAVALNGVTDLLIENATARNRKDVPVLGTFSAARFIAPFIDDLVRVGATTELNVRGEALTAASIQHELQTAINAVHHDVVVSGAGRINAATHASEYGLFHNQHGIVDGNSYSFLTNGMGVAVNGFPTSAVTQPSRDVTFRNVHVVDQHAFINEVPALDNNGAAPGGKATIDPVGAVFQVRNVHPDTGAPLTISSLDDSQAAYLGNPVANAQAFVAKAIAAGEGSGTLDVSRSNFSADTLAWVEGVEGGSTLLAAGATYLCNGDSMFHVNKGVIGFKIDAAVGVHMVNTSVDGLVNLGQAGTAICGDYSSGANSHPDATLPGYGGAAARGFTFAGSSDVHVDRSDLAHIYAIAGPAVGFAMLTDSSDIRLANVRVNDVLAGSGAATPGGPNNASYAAGVSVGSQTNDVLVLPFCTQGLGGSAGAYGVYDPVRIAQQSGTSC